MAALYAKCPLCERVFDAWDEPSTKILVDGAVRYACKCINKPKQEQRTNVDLSDDRGRGLPDRGVGEPMVATKTPPAAAERNGAA